MGFHKADRNVIFFGFHEKKLLAIDVTLDPKNMVKSEELYASTLLLGDNPTTARWVRCLGFSLNFRNDFGELLIGYKPWILPSHLHSSSFFIILSFCSHFSRLNPKNLLQNKQEQKRSEILFWQRMLNMCHVSSLEVSPSFQITKCRWIVTVQFISNVWSGSYFLKVLYDIDVALMKRLRLLKKKTPFGIIWLVLRLFL